MWQHLRDNPEVVWGFLLALGVVVVLTPAVGRFARILGVVDHPGESRRLDVRPIPRLGGIALLLGIFVPALAFLTLDGVYRGILLGAAVAACIGVVDDFRGLPWGAELDVRRDRPLAREAGRRDPVGDRRGRLLRLSAPQLLSGADLHGRLGSAVARLCARDSRGPGPAEDRGDRRPLLPAARPGRADRG